MCTPTKKTSATTAYNEEGKYVRKQNWVGMNWISQWMRYSIYARDNFTCVYCGTHCSEAKISLDHLIPESIEKCDHETNLVTCCCKCNSSRADRSVEDFATAVANYINFGATKESILAHIACCITKPVDTTVGKQAVKQYGSCAKALQAIRDSN